MWAVQVFGTAHYGQCSRVAMTDALTATQEVNGNRGQQ